MRNLPQYNNTKDNNNTIFSWKFIEILRVVEILSRHCTNNHNLGLMLEYKTVIYPAQIAKIAANKLISYITTNTNNMNPTSTATPNANNSHTNISEEEKKSLHLWWQSLYPILMICLRSISNFTNPYHYWIDLQLGSRSPIITGTLDKYSWKRVKDLLLELGLTKMFKGNSKKEQLLFVNETYF